MAQPATFQGGINNPNFLRFVNNNMGQGQCFEQGGFGNERYLYFGLAGGALAGDSGLTRNGFRQAINAWNTSNTTPANQRIFIGGMDTNGDGVISTQEMRNSTAFENGYMSLVNAHDTPWCRDTHITPQDIQAAINNR